MKNFNPDDGLDIDEVAILAVLNNDDLKTARDEKGIASAQLIAAGILPNPQLTASVDHPISAGPEFVNAFNIGLSYEISALLTRNAALGAARANKLKIDLTVLWQEWQVAQQARMLFVKILAQQQAEQLLDDFRTVLDDRYRRALAAQDEGLMTITEVSADLAALQETITRISELKQKLNKDQRDLNALMGFAPEVNVALSGPAEVASIDDNLVKLYLDNLSKRRPDLMALQAGYASQEQTLRKAVIAQFPSLSIGPTRARDTSDVNTIGLSMTLSLPIFDRNQGNIATEKATRQKLYDEYQARLNEAYSQVFQIQEHLKLLCNNYEQAKAALPEIELAAIRAKTALDEGNLSINAYIDLLSARVNKRIDIITTQQDILGDRIMLVTLLGADLKDIAQADIGLEEGGK